MSSRASVFQIQLTAALLIAGFGLANASLAQVETKNEVGGLPMPTWKMMDVDTKASLRGLHVFDAKHIFASGTGGTVVQTRDGGKSWSVQTVPGAEALDFRDIHAIDPDHLVTMSSGSPARMYRSKDGGKTWMKTFERTDEKFFLDAIAFWDDKNGLVMGDPIDGRVLLLRTTDGGNSWKQVDDAPKLLPGEAGFAASGTNMVAVGENTVLIALGGALEGESFKTSRVLVSNDRGKNWQAAEVPIPRSPSAGMFSLYFVDSKNGIAVGGDYKNETATAGTIATTDDGGKTWSVPAGSSPTGFRSCVASFVLEGSLNGPSDSHYCLGVGPTGTDASIDNGNTWFGVSKTGFHAIGSAATDVWASGSGGRIGKLKMKK